MSKLQAYLTIITIMIVPAAWADEFAEQTPRITYKAAVETTDKLVVEASGELVAAYVAGLSVDAGVRYEWRNATGDQIRLDASIGAEHFSNDTVNSVYKFGIFGEYRHRLAQSDQVQMRYLIGLEQSQEVFSRMTGQIQMHVRHDRSHASQFRLRYRFRDQDDSATFSGFDQVQTHLSYQHVLTPDLQGIKRVTGQLYGDVRSADFDRFSHAEVGGDLQVRLEPIEDWTVTGRFKVFTRSYQDSFAIDFEDQRSDRRTSISIESKREILDGVEVSASLGWETNRSNVVARSFSGPLIGIGVSHSH